eukprot:g5096.t1
MSVSLYQELTQGLSSGVRLHDHPSASSMSTSSLEDPPAEWRRLQQVSGAASSPAAVAWHSTRDVLAVMTDACIQVIDVTDYLLGASSSQTPTPEAGLKLVAEDFLPRRKRKIVTGPQALRLSQPPVGAAGAPAAPPALQNNRGAGGGAGAAASGPGGGAAARAAGVARTLQHALLCQHSRSTFVSIRWDEVECTTTSCGKVMIFGIQEHSGQKAYEARLLYLIDAERVRELNIGLIGSTMSNMMASEPGDEQQVRRVVPDHTRCAFTTAEPVFVTSYLSQVLVWNMTKSFKTSLMNCEEPSPFAGIRHIHKSLRFKSSVTGLATNGDTLLVGLSNGKIVATKLPDLTCQEMVYNPEKTKGAGAPGIIRNDGKTLDDPEKTRTMVVRQRREGAVHLMDFREPDLVAAAVQDSVILLGWQQSKWVVLAEYLHTGLIVSLHAASDLLVSTDADGISCFFPLERGSKDNDANDLMPKDLPKVVKVKPPMYVRAVPEPAPGYLIPQPGQPHFFRPRLDLTLPCCGFALSPGRTIMNWRTIMH